MIDNHPWRGLDRLGSTGRLDYIPVRLDNRAIAINHKLSRGAQRKQAVDAPPLPVHDLGAARRDPRGRPAHRQRVDLARAAEVGYKAVDRGVGRQVLDEHRGVMLVGDVRALVVRVRRVAAVVDRRALFRSVLSDR